MIDTVICRECGKLYIYHNKFDLEKCKDSMKLKRENLDFYF